MSGIELLGVEEGCFRCNLLLGSYLSHIGHILMKVYTCIVDSSLFGGGPMFKDFVGHPHPWIYIPMNMFLNHVLSL
jgi:hypothetical protein